MFQDPKQIILLFFFLVYGIYLIRLLDKQQVIDDIYHTVSSTNVIKKELQVLVRGQGKRVSIKERMMNLSIKTVESMAANGIDVKTNPVSMQNRPDSKSEKPKKGPQKPVKVDLINTKDKTLALNTTR